MAHTKHTLTRSAYTSIATGAVIVTVQLPKIPFRIGGADRAELVIAASAPSVPTDNRDVTDACTVLDNTTGALAFLGSISVPDGENIYARWVGSRELAAAEMYVVTF